MATFTIKVDQDGVEDLTLAQLEYEYDFEEGELAKIANLPIAGEVAFADGTRVERTS